MARLEARLARHAVPIDSTEFGALLAEVVGDRRLVCLGESHHFVHETYALRARVLRELGRLRFAVAGFEISRTDGARLDDHLSRRDLRALDRVNTFGYRTPDDLPYEGILADATDRYPSAAMRNEYEHLLRSLRDTPSKAGRWSVFGFDVDYAPGTAAERLVGVDDPIERARCETTLATSRRYDAAVRVAGTYEELRDPMAWREQLMFDHVQFELARKGPGAKVVLCGHNLHLAANTLIKIGGGVGPGGAMVPPLGAALRAAGHRPATIWMLHDHGVDSGPPPSSGVVAAPEGSLNRVLGRVGSEFAIAADALSELCEEWPIASIYNTVTSGVPAQQCDLIVFAAETTALRTS